jgi:hypothetical protein
LIRKGKLDVIRIAGLRRTLITGASAERLFTPTSSTPARRRHKAEAQPEAAAT